MENPDEAIKTELNELFAQSANTGSQAVADEIFEYQKAFEAKPDFGPIVAIRASSPHVLTIYPHFDTQIGLTSDLKSTTVTICPIMREESTFGFNMGIEALRKSLLESWVKIPDAMSAEVLNRLPLNQMVSDHGDLPRWLRMARTDLEGSLLVKIDDDSGSHFSDENKLSAYFSKAARPEGSRPVDHTIMTGLWTLGLALKIQEQARASGTVYDLMRQGKNKLTNGSRDGITRMLLALDQ